MSFDNYLIKLMFSLFIISTDVKLALILNQAESHLIKPTTCAQQIARERFVSRKIDGDVKCVVERCQRQHVTVSIEASRHRAEAKVSSGFNINTQCRGKFPLEDTERSSGVHVGVCSNCIICESKFDRDDDRFSPIVVD